MHPRSRRIHLATQWDDPTQTCSRVEKKYLISDSTNKRREIVMNSTTITTITSAAGAIITILTFAYFMFRNLKTDITTKIDDVKKDLNGLETKLTTRIDGLETRLDTRLSSIEAKVDKFVYDIAATKIKNAIKE